MKSGAGAYQQSGFEGLYGDQARILFKLNESTPSTVAPNIVWNWPEGDVIKTPVSPETSV